MTEKAKWCPIMCSGFLAAGNQQHYAASEARCDKENCGIWDEKRNCCGFITAAPQ